MNPTQHSLLSQMQIHDMEISKRKALLNFTPHDANLLAACSDFMDQEVHDIVHSFYEKQTAVDDIAVIIGDADTLNRLRQAMTRYVKDLFSGLYDETYVNNRLRIGLVHKRIGVAPKYYLSAMHLLKGLLFNAVSRHLQHQAQCQATLDALDKLLYFDNEFVFDTYIRSLILEIETTKDHAVQHALRLEDMVNARTQALEDMSRRDALTGLYNLRHFMDTLQRELARARRHEQPVALIYLDIDHFKQINDQFGHLHGDQVLRDLGTCLNLLTRAQDLSCRHGGDEFCVLLPDTPQSGADTFAARLQARYAELHPGIGLSIGVTVSDPRAHEEAEALLARADHRMYQAKRTHHAPASLTQTPCAGETRVAAPCVSAEQPPRV